MPSQGVVSLPCSRSLFACGDLQPNRPALPALPALPAVPAADRVPWRRILAGLSGSGAGIWFGGRVSRLLIRNLHHLHFVRLPVRTSRVQTGFGCPGFAGLVPVLGENACAGSDVEVWGTTGAALTSIFLHMLS